MRRKPEFDRFTAGLSQRVSLWINDPDATHQDLVNLTRSELSRIWKYLIEKVNKSEQEIQKLKADREVLLEALKFIADHSECGGKRARQVLKSIGEIE
jgi:hypothetical protein